MKRNDDRQYRFDIMDNCDRKGRGKRFGFGLEDRARRENTEIIINPSNKSNAIKLPHPDEVDELLADIFEGSEIHCIISTNIAHKFNTKEKDVFFLLCKGYKLTKYEGHNIDAADYYVPDLANIISGIKKKFPININFGILKAPINVEGKRHQYVYYLVRHSFGGFIELPLLPY